MPHEESLSHEQKFAACYEMARRIVAGYRAQAPKGCDPKNTWVTVGTAVVTTGVGMYQANKASKDAKKAASAGKGKALPMPEHQGFDLGRLQALATHGDTQAYRRSDRDFLKRHPGFVQAEKLFEAQTLKDQQGESELMPMLQNEFMRSGLAKSLDAFGGSPSVLTPGSAGESSVARNLGLSIMGFQDRNRQNRERSLVTAEELFPRRSIGMSGGELANLDMQNVQNRNNWEQANWQTLMGAGNAQQAQANQLAAAQAQAKADQTQATMSSATQIAAALAKNYGSTGGRTTAAQPVAYNSSGPVYQGRIAA